MFSLAVLAVWLANRGHALHRRGRRKLSGLGWFGSVCSDRGLVGLLVLLARLLAARGLLVVAPRSARPGRLSALLAVCERALPKGQQLNVCAWRCLAT